MRVGPQISESFERRDTAASIHEAACQEGMLSLAENAALKIYRGEMTADDANQALVDPTLAELSRLTRD